MRGEGHVELDMEGEGQGGRGGFRQDQEQKQVVDGEWTSETRGGSSGWGAVCSITIFYFLFLMMIAHLKYPDGP